MSRFHLLLLRLEDDAFRNCKKLREVALNEELQKIGAWSFWACKSLESITLPSTVVEVGDAAHFIIATI